MNAYYFLPLDYNKKMVRVVHPAWLSFTVNAVFGCVWIVFAVLDPDSIPNPSRLVGKSSHFESH